MCLAVHHPDRLWQLVVALVAVMQQAADDPECSDFRLGWYGTPLTGESPARFLQHLQGGLLPVQHRFVTQFSTREWLNTYLQQTPCRIAPAVVS